MAARSCALAVGLLAVMLGLVACNDGPASRLAATPTPTASNVPPSTSSVALPTSTPVTLSTPTSAPAAPTSAPAAPTGVPAAPTGVPASPMIIAVCNGEWAKSFLCRAAGEENGILVSEAVHQWVQGFENWDSTFYSIDGAAAVAEARLSFRHLAPGRHTLRVMELPPSGSGVWSAPYEFLVRPEPQVIRSRLPSTNVANDDFLADLVSYIPLSTEAVCDLLNWGVVDWLSVFFPEIGVAAQTLAPLVSDS